MAKVFKVVMFLGFNVCKVSFCLSGGLGFNVLKVFKVSRLMC